MVNGHSVRWRTMIAASALLVSASALPASAASDGDLATRVSALEAMVNRLNTELVETRAENKALAAQVAEQASTQSAAVTTAAALDQAPPGADPSASTPQPAEGFRVGETNLKIYGFADLEVTTTRFGDGSVASDSIARDFYIPGATPIGGDGTTSTDFTAQASRFGIAADREVAGRTLSGLIEMDFLGSLQGNERVSNSYSPRLRRAFGDYAGWRVGQDWSTFQNTSAIPESASFLVMSDGMVFIRQPLIRYTHGAFQAALENPETTVTEVGGSRIDSDTNYLPDGVLRYNLKGDFGNLSLAALMRELRIDQSGSEDAAFGWGLSASGRLNLWGEDDLRFNIVGGEGVGRYVGLNAINGAALNPTTGDLDAISSIGGFAAYHHAFSDVLTGNIGYSGLFADNPDFIGGSATKSVQSVYAALLWDVVPDLRLGGEIMFGRRALENGDDGTLNRFTVSTRYSF